MITLYTGVPGSGKSYAVVHDMLYPSIQNKYFILHNIDGLKHEKFMNPEMVRDWRTLIPKHPEVEDPEARAKAEEDEVFRFFSEENQTKLYEDARDKYGRPLLIVIDEAHRYLYRMRKLVSAWLSYHRHLGEQSVFLITQKPEMIHRDYRGLVEVQISAKGGHLLSVPYAFLYAKKSGKEVCGYQLRRKKKEVFECYKSFISEGVKTRKSMLFPAIAVMFGFGAWYWFQPVAINASPGGKTKEKNQVEMKQGVVVGKSEVKKEVKKEANLSMPKITDGIELRGIAGDYVIVRIQGVDGFLSDLRPDLRAIEINRNRVVVQSIDTGETAAISIAWGRPSEPTGGNGRPHAGAYQESNQE